MHFNASFRNRLLLVLFLLSGAVSATRAQGKLDLASLNTYLEKAAVDWKIPGMAIGIVYNDSLIMAKGYGVREVGKPEKVDENTLFAIASNTKAFTSAAIATLVDQGKLNWDDKAVKHLPGFQLSDPYVTSEMTVRDLLSHRSGLKTFSGDLLWFGSTIKADEVVRRARYLKPAHGFRSTFGYQNIMFVAAGQLVPALTGKSWESYIQEQFLTPLGMKRTKLSVTQLSGDANVAKPHVNWQGKQIAVPYLNYDNFAPAGALNSSVSDMSRWIRMQLARGTWHGHKYFSEAASREMWMPTTLVRISPRAEKFWPSKHFDAYGLGWNVFDYHGRKVVTHGGGLEGMISQVVMLPEENFGFMVLTNTDNSLPYTLIYEIIDRYMGQPEKDWSKTFLDFKTAGEKQQKEAEANEESSRNKKSKPTLDLKEYAGTYRSELYGDVEIGVKGKQLTLQMVPTPTFKADLTHWEYDVFKLSWSVPTFLPGGKVQFVLDMNGKVEELRMDVPNPDFDFTELKLKKVK